MLCAYSIHAMGAPIGAGLISREKHYDPFLGNFILGEWDYNKHKQDQRVQKSKRQKKIILIKIKKNIGLIMIKKIFL